MPKTEPGPSRPDGSREASRLQLGTSRLEDLDVRVLDAFLDKTWVHLGDEEPARPRRPQPPDAGRRDTEPIPRRDPPTA